MASEKGELPLVTLVKFVAYLLARIEAVEELLLQNGAVTVDNLQKAILAEERRMGPFFRGTYQDEASVERVLADSLEKLKSRRRARPR